jgi:hypothetical protein
VPLSIQVTVMLERLLLILVELFAPYSFVNT